MAYSVWQTALKPTKSVINVQKRRKNRVTKKQSVPYYEAVEITTFCITIINGFSDLFRLYYSLKEVSTPTPLYRAWEFFKKLME